MSGNHAETALSLTPVRGTWREILSTIFDSFQDHNRIATVPKTVFSMVVNPKNRVIEEQQGPFDLDNYAMRDDAQGQDSWLCVVANVRVGRDWFKVRIFLSSIDKDRTAIEIQFPSLVYESVYAFYEDNKEIDEAVKFDLIQFCVDISAAVGAEGFGYDYTMVHKVLGPPKISSLEQWVDNDPTRPAQLPDQWILAGVLASLIDIAQLRARDGIQPHVYELGGYTIYDLLWPSVLNE